MKIKVAQLKKLVREIRKICEDETGDLFPPKETSKDAILQMKHQAERYMNHFSHMFSRNSGYSFEDIVSKVSRFVMQQMKPDLSIEQVAQMVRPWVKAHAKGMTHLL